MKVNLLKIEERERNRGRGFMRRMNEAWNDIYEHSTMSVQTLKDSTAKYSKDNSLLNLIKVRDGNDEEEPLNQLEFKKTLSRMKTMSINS